MSTITSYNIVAVGGEMTVCSFSFFAQTRCTRCNGTGRVQEMDQNVQCTVCFGEGFKRYFNRGIESIFLITAR